MAILDELKLDAKKHSDVIGIIATVIGIISFIPVVLGVYRTKKTNNFPYQMLILALISNLLWIIYGVVISADSTIIMGALYFGIYTFILFVKSTNK
tara:strand:+ start:76 stop:363 length:288 start_codon:yes stop_codon:yes gene_type:complete